MTKSPDKAAPRHRRIVRYWQLESEFGVGWSRQHVERMEKAGRFPKRIRFGENSVGWFSDEIKQFIAGRVAVPAVPLPNNLPKAWAAKAKRRAAKSEQSASTAA